MAGAKSVTTLFIAVSLYVLSAGNVLATPDVLKFAAEPYPPFTYEESGKGAGPIIDVLQAVCASAKINCPVQVMPWRRTLTSAEAGILDGVCVVLRTPEREKMFFITDDVVRTSLTFFTRTGSTFNYRTMQDLNDMTVGVYGPSGTSATLEELTKQTSARMEIELDNITALRKLAAGRYGPKGAILINREVAMTLIKENGISGVAAAGDAKTIDYAFGLSHTTVNQQQAESFNSTLRALKHAGTIKEILQKYGLMAAP
jgi:polar amino acid transport system substrate-binding protein